MRQPSKKKQEYLQPNTLALYSITRKKYERGLYVWQIETYKYRIELSKLIFIILHPQYENKKDVMDTV